MRLEKLFGPEERAAIAAAVNEAEKITGGEIVPYVVAACDDYEVASWRGVALGALLASLLAAGLYHLIDVWGVPMWAWIALPPAAGAALGFALVASVASLRRWLIPAEILERRAQRRAQQAFLEEEVFQTRDRTGILIFLALFERRAVVLGDTGIQARVRRGDWAEVIRLLVEGMRAGRPEQALVEAVRRCGRLLQERQVTLRPDDSDELRDDVRLRED